MIPEKLVLFLCEVITKKLGWVMKHNIIKELCKSFLNNYQNKDIILRKGGDFVFQSVDLLTYSVHKISLRRGRSYIKAPEWVINKRATVNPKNKDKCFQYSVTVALKHQNIKNHPERISNIKPSINQYNWGGIDFPAVMTYTSPPQNTKTINLI